MDKDVVGWTTVHIYSSNHLFIYPITTFRFQWSSRNWYSSPLNTSACISLTLSTFMLLYRQLHRKSNAQILSASFVWLNRTDSILSAPSRTRSPDLPPFLYDWALARTPEMRRRQASSLPTFTHAFIWYENRKNTFCWCRWLGSWALLGEEKPPVPSEANLLLTWYHSIFISGPFKSLCTPFQVAKCILDCLWIICPIPPIYNLPTTNFLIHFMEVPASFFCLKVPSQFAGYYSISLPQTSFHEFWQSNMIFIQWHLDGI